MDIVFASSPTGRLDQVRHVKEQYKHLIITALIYIKKFRENPHYDRVRQLQGYYTKSSRQDGA